MSIPASWLDDGSTRFRYRRGDKENKLQADSVVPPVWAYRGYKETGRLGKKKTNLTYEVPICSLRPSVSHALPKYYNAQRHHKSAQARQAP